jgi:hypothetical protein
MRSLGWYRNDDGSVMAAVVMLLMVVTVVGIASVQVAQHSNDASSVGRERLQTIESAEAGINHAIGRIEAGAGCDATATSFADLNDGDDVVGRYRTRIDAEAGTTCGQTPRRVIHSWGYAPTGGTRALRHLEVSVELIPQTGFPYTLFAEGTDGTIYVKNTGTINGDAYAENLDQSKNNLDADSIITTGAIHTKNNAAYSGTLWAAGNIIIGDNGNIGQSVLSSGTAPGSDGSVMLDNNTVVGQDVLAKGVVTQDSGVVVNGSVSQNNPNVPAPPTLTKPAFTWNPANYTPTPFAGTAAQVTSAMSAIQNNLQGTFYANNTSGTVVFPANAIVTGPLTVISEGKVDLGRTLTPSGGPHQVVVIAKSTATDAIDFAQSFTAASGLHVLLYTLGGVDGRNNVAFTGAIYANSIDAKNTFAIQSSESLRTNPPVGFTWDVTSATRFSAVPTLWREVVPGPPPA